MRLPLRDSTTRINHVLYFDYNATSPLCAPAREAWLGASERHWHNPSSLYRDAGIAAQHLDAAREQLADLLTLDADRITFTSGATEGVNAAFASLPSGSHVAISAIEHPAVREAAIRWIGPERIIEIPIETNGQVCLEQLRSALQSRPALVAIMAANNESGSLQPIEQIATICRSASVPLLTDATQWMGKEPPTAIRGADWIIGSAHKFMGPKGVGFIVLPTAQHPLRFIVGGPQEQKRRAGTENYPGIAAMVAALDYASQQSPSTAQRDSFEAELIGRFCNARIIDRTAPRLWNTTLVVMPRHSNLKWVTRLSRRGIAVSTGSACSSGKEGSSIVVSALGATPDELRRVLRFSSGWQTPASDWEKLLTALTEIDTELTAELTNRE